MLLDEFTESEHPRGQPGNPGQFAPAPGGGGSEKKGESESKSEERHEGETDKEFAKRIVDKREPPKSLPEKYNEYFDIPKGSQIIPLDKLVSTKSEEENSQGAENGAKRMEAASKGELSKRAPISVKALPNGQFEIVDGNGTYSSVKKYDWKGLPVTIEGGIPQPNFKGNLARETAESTTQPTKSIDELYDKARKAEGPFKETMSSIASKYNSEVEYTPPDYAEPGTILKSRKSAERKLTSELGGDAALLRDVIRATIVSHKVEDTRKAAAAFIGEHSDNILRVKDRYVDQLKGGYRDILINYRTPEGLVAEVQFNSKNMVNTKNGEAHKLYEQVREMPPGLGSVQTILELEKKMSALYEKAYLDDGDSKWKQADVKSPVHDSTGSKIVRAYKLSQSDGPSFQAAIVSEDDVKVHVVSNRDGTWKRDDNLHFADLVMPEQALSDWDVVPIEPDQLEKDKGDAFDKGASLETRDGFARRAIDRSRDAVDIEYYTSESLGPNRERTPEGFLICYDVPAARVGEMTYGPGEVPPELGVGRDGRIRVTRSEAEVFAPRSMASLNGKPVTDDHPPVDVDPHNWHFYTKGVVVNPRRGDGDQKDFLVVDMIIYDDEMIRDIEAGKREVSCGYNPDYLQLLDPDTREPIPGRGEQVKIIYNHCALVKAGRCGPFCAIGDRKTVDQEIEDSFWSPSRARRLRRLLRRVS